MNEHALLAVSVMVQWGGEYPGANANAECQCLHRPEPVASASAKCECRVRKPPRLFTT